MAFEFAWEGLLIYTRSLDSEAGFSGLMMLLGCKTHYMVIFTTCQVLMRLSVNSKS